MRGKRSLIRKHHSIIVELYIAILGMLGFSLLGQHLLLEVLHLPFSLMEIYYLPILIYKRNTIIGILRKVLLKQTKSQIFVLMIVVTSMLLGVVNSGTFSCIIEYRSIIYLLLVLFIVYRGGISLSLYSITKIGMYSIIGELLYIVVFSNRERVSTANCVMMAVVIFGLFIQERYTLSMAFFAICLVMGTVSGYRIGIIITVVCFVEAILFMVVRRDREINGKTLFKRAFILLSSMMAIMLFVSNYTRIVTALANLTGMSQFAVFRMTTRMESLLRLDFATSQDTIRSVLYKYPFERFVSSIIPRGLIGTFIGEYPLYIDVPILYLYDIFGSLVSWIIVIRIVFCLFKIGVPLLSSYGTKKSPMSYTAYDIYRLVVLIVPILIVLLIVNGSFMVIVYQAIETGMLLGFLLKVNTRKNVSLSKIR